MERLSHVSLKMLAQAVHKFLVHGARDPPGPSLGALVPAIVYSTLATLGILGYPISPPALSPMGGRIPLGEFVQVSVCLPHASGAME